MFSSKAAPKVGFVRRASHHPDFANFTLGTHQNLSAYTKAEEEKPVEVRITTLPVK